MGIIASGLGVTLLGLKLRSRRVKWVFVVLTALGWLFTAVALPPALTFVSPYAGVIAGPAILVVGTSTFVLSLTALIEIGRTASKLFWRSVLLLALSAALFILPFALWTINVVTGYYAALALACLASAGVFALAWLFFSPTAAGPSA